MSHQIVSEKYPNSKPSAHPLYYIWDNMIGRCYNPNRKDYSSWGGRGITVCDQWRASYLSFYDDMLEQYEPKLMLGRIDNYGMYCPENCRFESRQQQMNNKRDNRLVAYQGQTTTIAEWSRITGMSYMALYLRIFRYRWPLDRVFSQRVRKSPKRTG